MIRRTFSRITRTDFQILYGAYVRSLLEYANPVVYSGRTKDVILSERVQRAATKMVAGLKSMDYETRLAVLDLFPLEYRRLRGDLILTYALFEQGLANRFFTVDPANTRRGHDPRETCASRLAIEVRDTLTCERQAKREEETFEDYTAVTDWERFVQSLENLLARWELRADGDPAVSRTFTCLLLTRVKNSVRFNNRFCLVFLLPRLDTSVAGCILANGSSNWSTSATLLARAICYKSVDVGFFHFCIYSIQLGSSVPHILDARDNKFDGHLAAPIACFGLTQALVLRPTEGEITGATRLHLLLSSVEMAVHAVRCPLPVLVAYSDPAYCYGVAAIPPLPSSSDAAQDEVKHEYQVSVLTGALNIDFSVGRMEDSVNPSCTHLDGLRELFLGKLGYPWRLSCPTPEVAIAARFTYVLPYWPEFAGLEHPSSLLSFDLTPLSSVFPQFHLAAVWPKVPKHAITQRPSYTVLKPEGAPDWYLQLFLGTSHADRLNANFSSSSTMANELTQQSTFADQPELLDWSRHQNRASREVVQLASQFNLPPATSLTHRLAVLLCNLNYLQPNPSSDSQLELMYNEFLLELKLRLDRLINLPTTKSFEESEQHSTALDPGERDDRAHTAVFTSRHNFSAFSDRERCDLHSILEHFSFYIEKARTSSSPSDSEFQDTQDAVKKEEDMEDAGTEPADEDEFFDASEDIPAAKLEPFSSPEEEFPDLVIIFATFDSSTLPILFSFAIPSPPTAPEEASEEARSILQWLHSLDLTRLLRLLMPSVCLEALITFHSLKLHPRLAPWYRNALDTLKLQIQIVLDRLSPGKANLDGCATWEERIAHTFAEALTLLAQFASRLTCLRELIMDYTLHGKRGYWPNGDAVDRGKLLCSLSFSSAQPELARSSSHIEHFRFTSSPQTWFSSYPPLDLRQPIAETYILQTVLGQPNPLASRPGPQRLYVQLSNKHQGKTYDCLSLAGAFSHDTQFF
ncbi:Rab3 GTPase-activating protein catalytic subunit [Clonorchis sinensis]|uniref:Rab3 GTPase-activating protein catalytic subunit n=1 Tax=Clonorchis sinensis TaxID=79923 RepID=G7YKY4_CLOSI|nr:Rab3 GTPase-activating protein catalytic subunit [Clonorchis sinensis]